MCGITGVVGRTDREGPSEIEQSMRAMTESLSHRGPDDAGTWVDSDAAAALGHQRLAILDLSDAGKQPMESPTGRFAVTYNGEIYNFEALRSELSKEGWTFRGSSDTEVLLAAVEGWGLDEFLDRARGMFAFGLVDREESRLHLVRDRLGQKPLYYARLDHGLVFASELKALHEYPASGWGVDQEAIEDLLRFGYIPSPSSIHDKVSKVSPGSVLEFEIDTGEIHTFDYWSLASVVDHSRSRATRIDEWMHRLDEILRDAVEDRLVAEVPVGALLSGGLDSSAIVAHMQIQSDEPVKTFTVSLEDGDGEGTYAKTVANHLGTDHTDLAVSSEDAISLVEDLAVRYDEPFADPSQIPTSLIAREASRHVKVALSGDGGDELLAGYRRYLLGKKAWEASKWLPEAARTVGARLLEGIGPTKEARKLGAMLDRPFPVQIYRELVQRWRTPPLQLDPVTAYRDVTTPASVSPRDDFVHWMMYQDMARFLPDDILVKVDRASMAEGLELRSPFLDHRLVEFAWEIPLEQKIRGSQGKWVLRKLLEKYVPKEIVNREKRGFGVPVQEWLRGPLRGWAESLLDPQRLRSEGVLDPEPIKEIWVEHVGGERDHLHKIWTVLMLQLWFEEHQDQCVTDLLVRTA